MKLLFLIQRFSFASPNLYTDLVQALAEKGHQVTVLAGTTDLSTDEGVIHRENGAEVVYVHLPNQFGVNRFRKGAVQLMMEPLMIRQLVRHLRGRRYDAVVYPTPPVTLAGVVAFAKKAFGAASYLMLKDIFPQNAVDLGMMRRGGPSHRYFRFCERRLYAVSDHIGCMSAGNMEYMKARLPRDQWGKLELFPNAIRVKPLEEVTAPVEGGEKGPSDADFPSDAGAVPGPEDSGDGRPIHFMFGGNLGAPQAIGFLLECLKRLKDEGRARFTVIGDGSEAERVREFIQREKLPNAAFHQRLPRDEYQRLLSTADVGLVMLSHRFTIPNYPSRMLAYMQTATPMLAATDRATDVRALLEKDARCGWWCPSDDVEAFASKVREICEAGRPALRAAGRRGYDYLARNFDVSRSVAILEGHFGKTSRNSAASDGSSVNPTDSEETSSRESAGHPDSSAPGVQGQGQRQGGRPDGRPGILDGFYREHGKRALDIALSAGALAGLSPVMAATALMVRARLGSPVLFTQDRAGRIDPATGRERIFRLYKFRSMTDERDASGNLLPGPQRLTPFGKALRATSLDELPQLLNILKGDMSVVGPRPLHVKYIPRYSPEQRRRHLVRPGLSGLAQVRGRNGITWEEKFRHDVEYVDTLSLATDVKIVLQSIRSALAREGINAGADLTMCEFMGTEGKAEGHD